MANNTAQSLVLFVKLDARYGRRLATPILSSKLHIPLISRLRTSFDGAMGLVWLWNVAQAIYMCKIVALFVRFCYNIKNNRYLCRKSTRNRRDARRSFDDLSSKNPKIRQSIAKRAFDELQIFGFAASRAKSAR